VQPDQVGVCVLLLHLGPVEDEVGCGHLVGGDLSSGRGGHGLDGCGRVSDLKLQSHSRISGSGGRDSPA